MTVRGGGHPGAPTWLSCRGVEWARRLGASPPMRMIASWVWVSRPTGYKDAARVSSRCKKRAPLVIVVPASTSVLTCSELSRHGLTTSVLFREAGAPANLDSSCARQRVRLAGWDKETGLQVEPRNSEQGKRGCPEQSA